jgi:hypothetical protein
MGILQIKLVMSRLRLKAKSQAKPAVEKPSQARPARQLKLAFGPTQVFVKPEPGDQAVALRSSFMQRV